jgi:Protein of unknown function (DUF3429)
MHEPIAPAAELQPPLAPALPAWALGLGYAGLIPFMLGAALVWLANEADAHVFATTTLAAYGAVIVSFLGGILWGLAFREAHPDPRLLGWGVSASLMAWVAAAMPPYAGLVVLGVLLIACYAMDRRLYPQHGAAHWLTLRFRLTAVASLCCFLGAAGS